VKTKEIKKDHETHPTTTHATHPVHVTHAKDAAHEKQEKHDPVGVYSIDGTLTPGGSYKFLLIELEISHNLQE
jgi:hypothetical protein